MPIKIKYTEDGLGVRYIAYEIVTGAEIIDANMKINSHKNFASLKYKIADRSKCSEYNVNASDVKVIAEQEREAYNLNPKLVVAFISNSDLQFGMSRMYHALLADQGFESESFDTENDALKWIRMKLRSAE